VESPADLSIPSVAAWLDSLAAKTGDPAYRRAAKALAAPKGGRPRANDADALAEMRALMTRKPELGPYSAASLIVTRSPRYRPLSKGAEKNLIERLVRKLRKK
jgi:hypothetical protein